MKLIILAALFLSHLASAEIFNVDPPLVEGRAIFAGPEYMVSATRTIIIDKVCEALGYNGAQADETRFAVVTGAQEFAFVGKGPDEKLMFYFSKVGRPDKKETIGYLSKLSCFKTETRE